jgi:hypothetical protein
MKTKVMIILLAAVMGLSPSAQALVITFQTTAPTPGPLDVFNFVGATRDANNVGTTPYDSWLNDEWTYIALDRAAVGQTFVTGASNPVYLLTGFWIQHVGYTENTISGTSNNGTWYSMPVNSVFGIRITDPDASGTVAFVLGSETYTVTGNEENVLPPTTTNTENGTGTWIHFVLDTPIPVAANKTYGFDVVSMSGNPNMFFEVEGIKDTAPNGNPYHDGTAYRSGANGVASNTMTVAPGDRVFLVELVGAPPATASIPYPADKAIAVPQNVTLRWVPGYYANQHDVYLGENLSDVEAATVSTVDIYKGRQDANSYTLFALTPDTTYYWRIDEVRADGSTIDKGKTWSFTTEPSKAWKPAPYNDEICVFIDPDPNLSWNSGYNATGSDVYFGTNPDNLEFQTTIAHTESEERYSYDISGLVNDQNYYWRIDQEQADSSVIQGDLWHFKTIPVIPISDPTLVGWWKFDEGPGKAIDWSGLNQHGTVYGGAESVYGYDGSAIQFDYVDDYVDLPIGQTISTLNSMTITTWVNFPNIGEQWQRIFNFGDNNVTVYMYLTPINGTSVPRFAITTSGAGGESGVDAPNALSGDWHHMAVTINGTTRTINLYIDDIVVASGQTQTLPSDLGITTANWLGRSEDGAVPPDPYLMGTLDDFRIYNVALSQDEIDAVMKINPLRARAPQPANGSTVDIIVAKTLSWLAGDDAIQHDIYFGSDAQAVENADISTTEIYRGRQNSTSYPLPEILTPNQSYYWRIDEISANATIGKGPVWTFNVADYILVDDFESYNDLNPDQPGSRRIYSIWTDGYDNPSVNGSTIGYPSPSIADGEHFVETDIVHGGNQSTPLFFDDTTASYSEVTVNPDDLSIGRDWTIGSPVTLSLWIYGDPTNSTSEQMYLKINNAKVTVNPNLTQESWQEVTVDLAAFNTNLSNVTTFGIGFERTGATGGSGMVFLDDIRLNLP